ncbi:MAG: butyrate kinase [Chloroflexota bacterium]
MHRVLVINPGSTSTEINLFEDEREIRTARMVHPVEDLRKLTKIIDQFPYRNEIVKAKVAEWGLKRGDLAAVVGRSGFRLKESGAYGVNQKMVDDVKAGRVRVEHASVLGGLLAKEIGDAYGAPPFIAHTAARDLEPIAKVTGIPQIERRPAYHVQNIVAVAILAAVTMKKDIKTVNFVVAHLEGGMSVAAVRGGEVIDATSAMDEGPFTMERSGNLPGVSLIELCFSGKYTREQMLKLIRGEGGMVAYLGTNKFSDVEDRVNQGDEKAKFYLEAMCYQAAKDIGAMATVLKGKVDAVILTGKILDSKTAVNWIKERVKFIAPVETYPEQEALVFVQAGLKVLRGEEKARKYE